MPFIVQCPHPECRKFMLLEDSTRGTMQDCLVCKKPIQIDAVAPVAPPPAKPARWSGGPPPSRRNDGGGKHH